MDNANTVTVELESAVGPRVLVTGEVDASDVESEIPAGWGVDWSNGVRIGAGDYQQMSYPLVQAEHFYAVRGQDYGTCEALRWAYTSIEPMLLAEGDDEEDVLERGIARAGHDDVRTYARRS
jgi:hypothetical protein